MPQPDDRENSERTYILSRIRVCNTNIQTCIDGLKSSGVKMRKAYLLQVKQNLKEKQDWTKALKKLS